MKEPIIFRDKAQVLLDKFRALGYDENSFDLQDDADEIVNDFLHLVFFFDREMPLYKDMIEKNEFRLRNLSGSTMEYYATKFIHYLDEYCVEID